MPDGMKRARRNGSRGEARKQWYSFYRGLRFNRRFGTIKADINQFRVAK